MTVYYGKLQLEGDAQVMPAVVRVEMGVLSLASGQTPLGEWKLYQVGMSERDQWIVLEIDEEKVYLDLTERARFLDETKTYRKQERTSRRRQQPEHPAFRKEEPAKAKVDPGPTRSQVLKSDVREEAAPLVEEGKRLLEKIPRGWPLWASLAAIVAISVFVPVVAGVLFGLLMAAGILAVLAGGVGYVEPGFGVRYPDPFTPTRLMLGGGACLLLAIPFAILS